MTNWRCTDGEGSTGSWGQRADFRIIERWIWGAYIVAGVSAIPSRMVTIQQLKEDRAALFEITKNARKKRWPPGIAGTFLFPFYLGTHFESDVVRWVQKRNPYRWTIWHEPVLYDIANNAVWMRGDFGHFGSAYYSLVFELYRVALTLIAKRLGNPIPLQINGIATAV